MKEHHTKTKGDFAVLKAQCDLAEHGYMILVPLTEHSSFDIAAYKDGKFLRIQVKYRPAKNGVIAVSFKSSWADKHGTHIKPVDKSDIDYYCVYCPDTDECYYFDPDLFGKQITLRISPPKNNQLQGVKMASDYKLVNTLGL